jgi:hypothetical protein
VAVLSKLSHAFPSSLIFLNSHRFRSTLPILSLTPSIPFLPFLYFTFPPSSSLPSPFPPLPFLIFPPSQWRSKVLRRPGRIIVVAAQYPQLCNGRAKKEERYTAQDTKGGRAANEGQTPQDHGDDEAIWGAQSGSLAQGTRNSSAASALDTTDRGTDLTSRSIVAGCPIHILSIG